RSASLSSRSSRSGRTTAAGCAAARGRSSTSSRCAGFVSAIALSTARSPASSSRAGRGIRMSMTDPVADLLTRIRNAQRAGLEELVLPASKLKQKVAEVLRDEGFVREVTYAKGDGPQGTLKVVLKYDEEKRPAISEIRRQSKPGLRRYVRHTEIPKVMNGLGIA